MLPSAHYFSGVIIFSIMGIAGLIPKTLTYLVLMVVLSLCLDLDFLLSNRHREIVTHSLVFWGVLVSIMVAVRPEYWIVAPPVLVHLLLDSIDWGVMTLYPFSKKKLGLRMIKSGESDEPGSFSNSIKTYMLNRKLLYLEGILLVTSIFLLVGVIYCS
ncbi:metal-dependent hydrolase [Candidatus Bathyarchaeota archaeon]|nr:metal-dependent hydrolase [Candidatus Bathyarchaeota archaeon]